MPSPQSPDQFHAKLERTFQRGFRHTGSDRVTSFSHDQIRHTFESADESLIIDVWQSVDDETVTEPVGSFSRGLA